MTIIAGIIENKKVFIGADSAATDDDGNLTIRKDLKVFRVGEFLIGGAGSFRVNQIVECVFTPPNRPSRMNIWKYMISMFITELRITLSEQGIMQMRNSCHEFPGEFLIGYKGRLFLLYDDFGLEEIHENYHACGIASSYAMASLHTSSPKIKPEKRLEQALLSACKFNSMCAPPIIIKSI